jgi:hypothetical protein
MKKCRTEVYSAARPLPDAREAASLPEDLTMDMETRDTTIAPSSSDRTISMFAHLGGIVAGFIPALVIYLVKKDESRWVREQAAEALNFQLTVLIASLVAMVLLLILIGFVLLPLIGIANLVLCIIAGIKANDGVAYRYPVAIRMVS